MGNQGLYKAVNFLAVAQNNLVGAAFGARLASAAQEADAGASTMMLLFRMGSSWWVWP